MYGYRRPRRPEASDAPGAGVTGGYECWELNSSPLQNPYALLTLSHLSSAMNYFMS